MADLSSLLGAAGIGGAIGKAIVSLELETTKYQGELKAMQAETVASTNTSSGAFSKFGGIANAALLGVGAAAVAGAALSVKAAIEANDAHLKLQNTFANNAMLADSSVEAFEAQADALRDLTGVDDEAIITGQALLGSFKLTGAQVQELTPLVVDLSEKYNIDLQTAFKAVGKATAGSSAALSRFGVVLDASAVQGNAYKATLDGIGVAQGFAEKSAKAEPWRVLGAQLEEVAEQIGQSLLPAIQSLSELLTNLLPLISKVAEGFSFLPLVQMSEGFDSNTDAVTKFSNALVDSIPVLGHFVDLQEFGAATLGHSTAEIARQSGALDSLSETYREKLNPAVVNSGKAIVKFAHMTGDDLKKWSDDTKDSFQSYVINLDKVQEETDFTRKDLRDSFRAMLEHARNLNDAMRTLSREHWINDDFVKFLAEQPDKLILFADSNETQQRRMQHQWELSGDILKHQINDHLDDMIGVLDKLDKGESKHTVIIEYRYEGFDPSKPGMSGSAQQR